MKRLSYFLMTALMVLAVSCGQTNVPEENVQTQDTVEYMTWQEVDSTTSHINLSDSACITMSMELGNVVFETQGVSELTITTDSTQYFFENPDGELVVVPFDSVEGKTVKIQADSTELELNF